jgi:DNA-binding response OmpR family regulator
MTLRSSAEFLICGKPLPPDFEIVNSMTTLVNHCVPCYATATMAKVLVIDSCESIARDFCSHLASQGFSCKYATSGAAAIAVAKSWQPQLVVIDLGSPQMSGFYTAQSLREIPGMQHICVIGITEHGNELRRGQTGIDQFLLKSTSPEELVAAVHAGCSQLAS